MATVKEVLEGEYSKRVADATALRVKIDALPAEAHALEESVWVKIKTFFEAL